MKTLHIYSGSKIAFIFTYVHLLFKYYARLTACSHTLKNYLKRRWYLDVRHSILQKLHWNNECFSVNLTKSKSVAFSLLLDIYITEIYMKKQYKSS